MLKNPRHHYLLLLLLNVLHAAYWGLVDVLDSPVYIVEGLMLFGLDKSVGLKDLVDSLFNQTHVNKHIALCDALAAKQVLVQFVITFHLHRDFLDTSLYLFDFLDVLALFFFHDIDLIFGKSQLLFKVLNHSVLLRIQSSFLQISVDLALHF